jgi:hypothetical protein
MINLFNQLFAYFSQSMFHVIMFGILIIFLCMGLENK